ncbi:MAG: hypothetical protein JKY37_18775 [Nannocystaceae bacterium]|nr:hypothetical protein [Nannocystaceae bacterium]
MSRALAQLCRGLEALYQTNSGLDPLTLVRPHGGPMGGAQELLLVRESADGALEVALVLDHAVLRDFDADALADDARLGGALPVLEGLSHLCYVAEAARQERPISGLELETQAEVDKLALTLLSRWERAHKDFDGLVDRLYFRYTLRPMDAELTRRYETANRVALAFSRRLRPLVHARKISVLRQALREFWRSPMAGKQALAA